tara:strand:+ start:136 stop:474 length:339 start_codon:yes stop_codon:yes gene_type:complete
MDLKEYVKQNQQVLDFVRDVTPGIIDRYVGTLDYASARFNTILLKLSQDPLKLDLHKQELEECFNIIQSFHKFTTRLITWPWILQPIVKFVLHLKGTLQVPKIKFLLDKVNN